MRLTKEEQETIICFNEADPVAYIYTCSSKWMKHCGEALGLTATVINKDGRKAESKEYELPKAWLKLPRKTRVMSALQRDVRKLNLCKSSKIPQAVGVFEGEVDKAIPSHGNGRRE